MPENQRSGNEETRQRIVMAALKVFGEKGYSAASISQIAREAAVSKGLTYHYFKSKEELLQGIFEMLMRESAFLHEGWEEHTPQQRLKQIIDGSFQWISEKPDVMRLLVSMAVQPNVVENLGTALETQRQEMIALYARLFSDLGYEEPELEAYYLGAALDGATLGFLALPKEYPLADMHRKILNKYQL